MNSSDESVFVSIRLHAAQHRIHIFDLLDPRLAAMLWL